MMTMHNALPPRDDVERLCLVGKKKLEEDMPALKRVLMHRYKV